MVVGEKATEHLNLGNDDVYMHIKFHVIPGREKEVIEYFEKSMDETEP